MKKRLPVSVSIVGFVVVLVVSVVLLAGPLVQAAIAPYPSDRSSSGEPGTNVYLKIVTTIKGDIVAGESMAANHEREIEVLTVDYGVAMTGSPTMMAGGLSHQPEFRDVELTKLIDSSSPKLLEACASGKHYRYAIFTFIKDVGTKPVPYLVLTLEDVMVTSFEETWSAGDSRMIDTVTLSYSRLKVEYTPFSETGTPKAPIVGGWDLMRNQPW